MNILFICHRIPYPPNKGDKLRAFHILKHLSKNHKICLVSLYDDQGDKKYLDNLKAFCEEVHLFNLNPILAKVQAFLGLFLRKPLSLGYFYSYKMQLKIRELLRSRHFDLIFGYSSTMAQYFMNENIRKIMDFVDCDSAKWGQYSRIARFPLSAIYAREKTYLEEYEKQIVERFDRLIVVSEAEKQAFSKFLDTEKFEVLINGVDTDFFQPTTGNGRHRLIFTGAMDYFANIDGVLYFSKEILPLIREKIPDVEFYIVGKNPPASIRTLAKEKGIFVTGYVKDVRPYLRKAAVSVVPLRLAQGIQNKILEAMASGLPVITTSKAVEGLNVKAGEDLWVSDTSDDFARKVITLLEESQIRHNLGLQARNYVQKYHHWPSNLSRINSILEFLCNEIPANT